MDLIKWLFGAVIMLGAWFVYDSKEKEVGLFLLLLGAIFLGIMFT